MTLTLSELKKELRAQARQQFRNPYKVGDILHHSWGYDQTNCDFYQVVEVKPASVVLRKIGVQVVEGSEGFMSENLLPSKDHFLTSGTQALTEHSSLITPDTPPITKRVGCYLLKPDGSPRYYIPVPYGCCDLWEGKPEYHSWYA